MIRTLLAAVLFVIAISDVKAEEPSKLKIDAIHPPVNWTAVSWRQAMDDRDDTQDTRSEREKDFSLILIRQGLIGVNYDRHGLFSLDACLSVSYGKPVLFLQAWMGPGWAPNVFIWLNGTRKDIEAPPQEVIDNWKAPTVWHIHGWHHRRQK